VLYSWFKYFSKLLLLQCWVPVNQRTPFLLVTFLGQQALFSIGELLYLTAGWIPTNQWGFFPLISCYKLSAGWITLIQLLYLRVSRIPTNQRTPFLLVSWWIHTSQWAPCLSVSFSIWELVGFLLTNELHFYWSAGGFILANELHVYQLVSLSES
jgi:hypothetical protein